MYRAMPGFDTQELPPLRRLKPLPKRRRTSDLAHPPDDIVSPMAAMLGAERIAEELIAQADSLSSQMALQSYYSSILSDAHGLLNIGINGLTEENLAMGDNQGIDLSTAYLRFAEGRERERGEDDRGAGDSDYVDHLQQPGNTKKRKVPANIPGSMNGREVALQSGGEGEEGVGVAVTSGRPDQNLDLGIPPSSTNTPRKGKITPATLAGLQHKEMLKHRKRQLAAVLGALSLGDTLALDQALSSQLPFVNSTFSSDMHSTKIRLSRRRGPRLARAAKVQAYDSSSPYSRAIFAPPTTQFTFMCHSATSDRLAATKEEVTLLRSRFEEELARQAAKAAKAAAEAKQAVLAASKAAKSKRADKAQQRVHTSTPQSGDQLTEFLDQPQGAGTKTRGSKKKKRNALAIASNPHHRKNYVPSRLPSSGQANAIQASQNAQNSLGPLPLRFLSAEIPPRRRKKTAAVIPTSQIVNPADEWICPRCEYSLLYGESAEYRRAVRNRKQILRRRRRAQERAAGGLSAPKIPPKVPSEDDDYDDDFEPSPAPSPIVSKQADWKEGPDIRGKEHDHLRVG
ncbi:hypothetical protein BJ138DRAFT_1011763 [Hygrophoropsis aurantiaca]|uniref:Uncharacterized protein n=1 Tax=Hygrophoropsis aurantiaca TaxID=72124 RepID=A0ACB8A682_9AGAM|nr:hypothetical protein BJ138DRAFT_1011763 [Hygrophoropsis aurantiaca]